MCFLFLPIHKIVERFQLSEMKIFSLAKHGKNLREK